MSCRTCFGSCHPEERNDEGSLNLFQSRIRERFFATLRMTAAKFVSIRVSNLKIELIIKMSNFIKNIFARLKFYRSRDPSTFTATSDIPLALKNTKYDSGITHRTFTLLCKLIYDGYTYNKLDILRNHTKQSYDQVSMYITGWIGKFRSAPHRDRWIMVRIPLFVLIAMFLILKFGYLFSPPKIITTFPGNQSSEAPLDAKIEI